MVLGNGMIATAFKAVDSEDVIYAASGLSNLKGADPEARLREETLLKTTIRQFPDKTFVYISSYSIDDHHKEANTPYLQHKKNMEKLVGEQASRYLILRTSNVVGKSRQPGNLMNFIVQHLRSGVPFEIWTETTRNLIDVEDLAQMARVVTSRGHLNEVLYLTHPADIYIYQIVRHFEDLTGLKGHYNLTGKGTFYPSDRTLAKELFEHLRLEPDPDRYTRQLIQKYFTSGIS